MNLHSWMFLWRQSGQKNPVNYMYDTVFGHYVCQIHFCVTDHHTVRTVDLQGRTVFWCIGVPKVYFIYPRSAEPAGFYLDGIVVTGLCRAITDFIAINSARVILLNSIDLLIEAENKWDFYTPQLLNPLFSAIGVRIT